MAPRKKKTSATPSTAEDYFFQAGEEEERAERWLSGNDLSKGLRFYASALEQYHQCVQLSSESDPDHFDALYNIVRLKADVWYEVYESGDYQMGGHVTQTGGNTVGLDGLLANIFESGTREGAHREILEGFKRLITRLPDRSRTWDVLHGYGLVLTTHIEEYNGGENDIREAFEVFDRVYEAQMAEYMELKRLLGELNEEREVNSHQTYPEKPNEPSKYANVEESVALGDFIETLTCTIKLAGLTPRNSGIENFANGKAQQSITKLLETVSQASQVVSTEGFSADIAPSVDKFQAALMDAAQTIGLWVASRLEPDQLEPFWRGENVSVLEQITPQLPEFVAHANGAQWANAAVESILDAVDSCSNDTQKWALLGAANKLLQQSVKCVEPSTGSPVDMEVLTTYSRLPKFQTGLEVGQMYISMGDIDVMRARLSTESAKKFSTTLLKNAVTYYTSAENTLSMGTIGIKTAGGVVRKQRRLRAEASIKKLMLQGDEVKMKKIPGWEMVIEEFK